MTYLKDKRSQTFVQIPSAVTKVGMVSLLAVSLAACGNVFNDDYKAGLLKVDHDERHPITVSREPATLSIPVHRGSYGLSPRHQARVSGFLNRYRSSDMGNSKLLLSVPSGSVNEVEAMQAVAEIRHLISEFGFDATTVKIRPYQARPGAQPPIRVSYMRFVAEGPECGNWPTNLARQFDNMHYENFGCFNQKNLAEMVANPADLLGPRTMTPRSEARRRTVWEKFVVGESTTAERTEDEKAKTDEE